MIGLDALVQAAAIIAAALIIADRGEPPTRPGYRPTSGHLPPPPRPTSNASMPPRPKR